VVMHEMADTLPNKTTVDRRTQFLPNQPHVQPPLKVCKAAQAASILIQERRMRKNRPITS